MMTRRLRLALAVVVCAAAAVKDARAEDAGVPADAGAPVDAVAEAQRAMERGVQLAAGGDHAAAIAEYRRAQDLVPEANLPYRYAADSYAALGRYAEAVDNYETYLRIKPNVRDAAEVRARADDLRSRFLEGMLDVECEPEGALVFVDGDPVARGSTPLKRLVLPRGEHTLVLKHPGYAPLTVVPRVVSGATTIVPCKLDPANGARPPIAAPAMSATEAPSVPREEARKPSKPLYATWWFWTGAAAVVGGVAAAIVLTRPSAHGPPSTSGGSYSFP